VGAVVAGFAATLALNVINPDALIARTNLNRPRIDAAYLAGLSDDAVPTLVARIRTLPQPLRGELTAALLRRRPAGGWRSWTLSRSRAASALASLRAVRTRLIVFDTSVVDLTDQLADPVDVLFGTRLGGGTDIDQAVAYAQSLITRASDTIMVLITDLFEGGDQAGLAARIKSIIDSGVTLVILLALADDGAPSYDHALAATCASLGAPAFACTPDRFPDLLACAIRREDLAAWAVRQGLQVAG